MSDPDRLPPSSDCPDLSGFGVSTTATLGGRRRSSHPPRDDSGPGVYRMLSSQAAPKQAAAAPSQGTAPSPRWEGQTLPAGRAPHEKKSPSRDAPRVGDLLAGRYELLGNLRSGGMGTIWRARDLRLEIDVAIKTVRTDLDFLDPHAIIRYEARAAAMLRHRAVVRVLDLGTRATEEPFLAMELLEGPSLLSELREKGHLSPRDAVTLILPVVSALDAAHAEGIVHRDLKPENIMLVAEGRCERSPKLVDFGVAKLLQSGEAVKSRRGACVGSTEYMAPEQVLGSEQLDHRADIWSVCVVLHEMLYGAPPFTGAVSFSILSSIVDDEAIAAPSLGSDDQADLWTIIERGLAKDMRKRWASMRELGKALAIWALARGIEADASGMSIAAEW